MIRKIGIFIFLFFCCFSCLSLATATPVWADENTDEITGDSAQGCDFATIQQSYGVGENGEQTDSSCWFCKIVVVMTNSFMSAAANALEVVQTLGKLILQYGFLLWLAYYILQQVSSMAPTTPAKMLQEILMMGFKVALAYVAVDRGIPVITDFFLEPVMHLALDYGGAVLNGIIGL